MARTRTMMGVETEFAVTGTHRNGDPIPRGDLLSAFIHSAGRHCPVLPSDTGPLGVFLANAGRLYIDCGHPEYATPECTDPWMAARYVRAGERFLRALADSLEERFGEGCRIELFRFQVDYQRPGVTWGCHESVLWRGTPGTIQRVFLPHLVSRIVYAGAGGFNPLSAGIEFTVSPRAWMLQSDISDGTTGGRGIMNSRDEPLAGHGWRRLHLICGESLGSDVATVLRLGTTALVVAALESGAVAARDVVLASPVEALHTIAADPACTATVRLREGGTVSALDLQRTYLRAVEAEAARGSLPAWTQALCKLWRGALADLDRDPASLSGRLDWCLKKSLTDRWLDRRLADEGLQRDWVDGWNAVLRGARERLSRGGGEEAPAGSVFETPEEAADFAGSARQEAVRVGLDAATLPLFVKIRRELQEIDARIGEIGHGIMDQMTRHGTLDHSLFDDTELARAIQEPPSVGRPRLRGEAVRQLSGTAPATGWASWTRVMDLKRHQVLRLDDPWQETPNWEKLPETADLGENRLRYRFLNEALQGEL